MLFSRSADRFFEPAPGGILEEALQGAVRGPM
jgi:hypothetical protein